MNISFDTSFTRSENGARSQYAQLVGSNRSMTLIDGSANNVGLVVRGMKFYGCVDSGEIDEESMRPHGSGSLTSTDGTKLDAEWTWGSCTFDV